MAEILFQILIYLGAAVIAVPLAARLGLGSVLGYLAAGIAIGQFSDWSEARLKTSSMWPNSVLL